MSEGTPARISRHTRLDGYVDRYATRTQGMTASEIRALFAVASRPEVVSLAGGCHRSRACPSTRWPTPWRGWSRFVAGTEVAVTVLEQPAGELRALPPVEVRPDGEVYDYAARYTAGGADRLRGGGAHRAPDPRPAGSQPYRLMVDSRGSGSWR